MDTDVRRSDTTPRVCRRRDDDRIDGDRNRRVFRLSRDVGERNRNGMRSGVAPLEAGPMLRLAGAGMIGVVRRVVSRRDVRVRRKAVVVVRVVVIRVRVHVLQHRRP